MISPTPSKPSSPVIVRQCTIDDVKSVANLWHSVFQPACAYPTPKASARSKTCEQWDSQLSSALSAKLRARYEARIHRLSQEAAGIRSQLAVLKKQGLVPPLGDPSTGVNNRRSIDRSKQKDKIVRSFFCFVALLRDQETAGGREIITGSVALSLAQPHAVLPPPFPSLAPWRCYVSNMAVDSNHRRLGIGSALLSRCERTARALGHTTLWLHIDSDNTPAADFYRARGYVDYTLKDVSLAAIKDKFVTHRCLLYKELRPWSTMDTTMLKVSKNNAEGTFIWEV